LVLSTPCEVAQNSTEEHGNLKVGHRTTWAHRMWGEAGDLGIDQHMDSSDPETYTQRMAPSSLFRSFAPKKTSGDLMVSGKCGVLCGESIEDHIGTGMH
jgi:hypothetical protein